MLTTQLNRKTFIVVIVLLSVLWSCNSGTAYKVRRIHKGHTRIAYSYGKRELPALKDTLHIPTANTATVDRITKVYPEPVPITTPMQEAEVEQEKPNFTVLNKEIYDRDFENYNKAPSPRPRANPFEKYVAPDWNHITQGSESMWAFVFGDFWDVMLVILIVLAIIALLGAIVIYGSAIAAAINAETWIEVLFILVLLALAAFVESM